LEELKREEWEKLLKKARAPHMAVDPVTIIMVIVMLLLLMSVQAR
jgi:hypothetical protein